jgi:hypothetical protein
MKKWWKDPKKRLEIGFKISEALSRRHNQLSNSPIREQIFHMSKYARFRGKVIRKNKYKCSKCEFRNPKRQLEGLFMHYERTIDDIIKRNNITTKKEAADCPRLWEMDNVFIVCEKHHNEISSAYKTPVPIVSNS